jgi:hypothetical protein
MSNSQQKRFAEPLYTFHATPDATLGELPPPPEGYPRSFTGDRFASRPFAAEYGQRRRAYLEHVLSNPAGKGIKGMYAELVRIAEGRGPVYTDLLYAALDFIEARRDCADFLLLGIIRLLHRYSDRALLPGALCQRAEEVVLDFKYHPEEPGTDSMCSWTENHRIMFAVNQFTAGRLFPDRRFFNSGRMGAEQAARARPVIERWLELRFRTGFSEWLSHVYYDEDITALLNLVDLGEDPELALRGRMVLDLIFADMAHGCFRGVFATTHGRSYAREKRFPAVEAVSDTMKLAFGMGYFSGEDNMSAAVLALSEGYRVPELFADIAAGHVTGDNLAVGTAAAPSREEGSGAESEKQARGEVMRQRMGILVKEAMQWGLSTASTEDGIDLLTLEAYTHPRTITLTTRMFDRFRWWENRFFAPFARFKGLLRTLRFFGLLPALAWAVRRDVTRNMREEANLYHFRTGEYMLSCAQDWRRGYGGDQQHVWQATLSERAVVFTTHPGNRGDRSAGYWVGNGTQPRAVQHRNVLIALYRFHTRPQLYTTNELDFTHAWFPRDAFDEVAERDGWLFGRCGSGYIALYSARPYRWSEEGENARREVIAPGRRNVWICECGSELQWGSFAAFTEALAASRVKVRGLTAGRLRVRFDSPSAGRFEIGWQGTARLAGQELPVRDYPRYDSPYARMPFGAAEAAFRAGEKELQLDFSAGRRELLSGQERSGQ